MLRRAEPAGRAVDHDADGAGSHHSLEFINAEVAEGTQRHAEENPTAALSCILR